MSNVVLWCHTYLINCALIAVVIFSFCSEVQDMEAHIKIHPICCLGCLSTFPFLVENEINCGGWKRVNF